MSDDVEKLRATLHLAVDLMCNVLAARGRRVVRTPVVHQVSETDAAFAQRELTRQGWMPPKKTGAR